MDDSEIRETLGENIMRYIEELFAMDSVSEEQKLSILKALEERLSG